MQSIVWIAQVRIMILWLYRYTVVRASNMCNHEVRAREREEAPFFHSL